jgi:hypothetical protein
MACGLPLAAQSSSYHIELSAAEAGTPPRILFVNDSAKPIEAFFVTERCASKNNKSHSLFQFDEDTLDEANSVTVRHTGDGAISGKVFIEHNGRYDTLHTTHPSTSSNGVEECDAQADAAVFVDGTYQGKEDMVRAIKITRDGISACVDDWATRFRTNSDESARQSALAEANRRVNHDKAEVLKSFHAFTHQDAPEAAGYYWQGRLQVDSDVLRFLSSPASNTHRETLNYVADHIATWKKKIDDDVAMKKLDAAFPPLSELAKDDTSTANLP